MMVALEGQHTELDTNAFWNCMPWAPTNARVLDIYFRSSLRMSSVRMKTKFGSTGAVWAFDLMVVAKQAIIGERESYDHHSRHQRSEQEYQAFHALFFPQRDGDVRCEIPHHC